MKNTLLTANSQLCEKILTCVGHFKFLEHKVERLIGPLNEQLLQEVVKELVYFEVLQLLLNVSHVVKFLKLVHLLLSVSINI
jgi:hypothetical protein